MSKEVELDSERLLHAGGGRRLISSSSSSSGLAVVAAAAAAAVGSGVLDTPGRGASDGGGLGATIVLSMLGSVLEFAEFAVFGYFAPEISAVFFPGGDRLLAGA
jgi:hypothetical protein